MNRVVLGWRILVAALLFWGCSGTPQTSSPTIAETPAAATATPTVTASAKVQFRVEVVATGLEVPWSLAFAPDGRLFFTERPGRVRVIANGRLQPQPVVTIPVTTESESGLMGLALDPAFQLNGYLYVMYSYRDPQRQFRNKVSRFTVRGNNAAAEHTLLDELPAASIHDGGRLKFGPDGMLYITAGDASQPNLAQQQGSLAGKLLRISSDGSLPADNPFPGSPVYSWGHRNPQGLAWHPETRDLYSTEHGPIGNDEVNLIEPGKNYGWPLGQAQTGNPNYVDPLLVFSPSVAPTGATFYQAAPFQSWRGSLFFTTLIGQHLHRMVLRAPEFRQVEFHERLLEGEYGRLRDVIVGPDGYLYLATSNRDGRGRPHLEDDRILRIVPVE